MFVPTLFVTKLSSAVSRMSILGARQVSHCIQYVYAITIESHSCLYICTVKEKVCE